MFWTAENRHEVKEKEQGYLEGFCSSNIFAGSREMMLQLRSLWTAFCLHWGLDVDTFEYDEILRELWGLMCEDEEEELLSEGISFPEFDLFMGQLLG